MSDADALQACLKLLDQLCEAPELCLSPASPYQTLLHKIALLNRRIIAARKRETAERDQRHVESAAIREQRKSKMYGKYISPVSNLNGPQQEPLEPLASTPFLARRRLCYICKQRFGKLHEFYDSLCPQCAELNFAKRNSQIDLRDRTALVTGGRIKIGFQIALKLLRAGASVVVTSRFPQDTLMRYRQEDDSELWLDRLKIFSADFRYLPTVQAMCEAIQANYSSLDVLINNAAQTVRRPPEYYAHLLAKESELNAAIQLTTDSPAPALVQADQQLHIATLLAQACVIDSDGKHGLGLFPVGKLDGDGQQIDRRADNSWIAELENVQLPELLEVHAVNALVPFILIQNLQPLLLRSNQAQRFVINVSAMEGHFGSGHKTGLHPHTNMAKAAMNMITRTCAERFSAMGIFMNSVDTGWVTNEYPLPKTEKMQSDGFQPPLDEIDGAARVLDPIFSAIASGSPSYGKFFKDYRETNW